MVRPESLGELWKRFNFTIGLSPRIIIYGTGHSFEAEVFAGDGMFLEALVGRRCDQTVDVWGRGAELFFDTGAISKKKIKVEGTWETNLVLLGYEVDLASNTISLPGPKILGAVNIIQKAEFNPGSRALSVHSVKELRGCTNHWCNTGHIWRWLAEPVNQVLPQADPSGIWIRCDDWAKWKAFWAGIQFIRDLTSDFVEWSRLFTGRFPDLVGIQKELTVDGSGRAVLWFSGDATPNCIGGVNWLKREFFVEHPDEFIRSFLPPNRGKAHINEVEYLAEIMCTATWNFPNENLVICGIADNSVSNMWYLKGKERSGAGLQLTRTFHRWLIEQRTRLYSFYCRSGHNLTADFLSRAEKTEIHQRAIENAMTRIDPRQKWGNFTLTVLPPWPTWGNTPSFSLPFDSDHFQGMGWQPGPYTVCQAGKNNGIRFIGSIRDTRAFPDLSLLITPNSYHDQYISSVELPTILSKSLNSFTHSLLPNANRGYL